MTDKQTPNEEITEIEIYFDDLLPCAQQTILKELNTTIEIEGWNEFPIFILEKQ